MKKLELNQMENLEGGLTSCERKLTFYGDFTATEACIICTAAGAAAGGAVYGGASGALTGWVSGAIGGLFTC